MGRVAPIAFERFGAEVELHAWQRFVEAAVGAREAPGSNGA